MRIKSRLSVLKAFCHENSVSQFSDSRAWRGFDFLTRIAAILRGLTALCTDGMSNMRVSGYGVWRVHVWIQGGFLCVQGP